MYRTRTTKSVTQQPVVPDTLRKVLDSATSRSGMSSPVPCTQHAQTSQQTIEVLLGVTTYRNRTSTTCGTGTRTGASAAPVCHSQVIYVLTLKTRMHSSRMRTVRSSSRLSGGVFLSACWDTTTPPGRHPPPSWRQPPPDQAPPGSRHPPCGQTHACKNITFATSLRTVIKRSSH